GTMRLGAQKCLLEEGTLARRCYGVPEIFERHRHRYEFNNTYMDRFRDAGLALSGRSEDGLVEVIELPEHPWFLASQFHPEFTSNPRKGHPLFSSFVAAARECQGLKLPRAAGA
ncbi:MAG TPA: gamma-glutamyl-gamma-aminobutyrate hydrolase family protein, partial [Gammaproteobacteria bacterium]